MSAGMTASNIHVIDAAQSPGRRVKPRILLNLVMGIFVGGVLGIGLAFLQEYMDNTIRTSDDVERYLQLPALGLIPMHVNGKRNNGQRRIGESDGVPFQPPLSSDDGENSIRAEAYRSLRTSILLCGSPAPKSLLITSSLPREGKTTTSLNLAAALASLGNKRVLVVDCDMRRPSLHKAAGVGKDPGIVQCLTGQLDVSKVIREVPGVANLYIIPCGPIPPNPAELLSSTAAGDLFRKLSSEFDFVLVDSPPLLSVTDSRILATQMDATVLVVRGNSTPRNAVRQARTLLSSANGRTLGVALNGLDVTRSGYGYHSYSGYSRYGDGRGYERDVEDFEDPQREI